MHLLNHRLGRMTALIALGGAALYSQGTQTASMTGGIYDKNGAPIAGVTIRLTSPALQGVRVLQTDDKGRFIARLLPPGPYQVQLTKEGLQTVTSSATLLLGATFEPRYTMVPTGGVVVEVVAAYAAVDKTDVSSSTNYKLDQVDKLPSGRTMESVALLTPGVTSGVGGRVQVHGAMTSGNLMLVDGQNVEDNAYATRGVTVIPDAIEEAQIITGAISAEYGNVEGGVMNTVTRSGSNEFTGQIRWDLSNPSWNATTPLSNRVTANDNKLADSQTYNVGGFIIKDRLWFYASYQKLNSQSVGFISNNAYNWANGKGAAYLNQTDELRRQIKLTAMLSQDHTLVLSWMNSANSQDKRNYSAAELGSLVPQKNTSELGSLALRSIWSTSVTTEVRAGYKKQLLAAGAYGDPTNTAFSPLYDLNYGLFYNNGIFNSNDGGDARDNKTANVKASFFFDLLGSHQLDTGVDFYRGLRRARNEQTVTGYIFGVLYPNPTTNMAYPYDVWVYQSRAGENKTESTGAYLNDKWSLNSHLNFQIGLRWDNYAGYNEDGSKLAGADGLSPRLGLKYDILGDQKYIFGASYARYNGKVLEGILANATYQGNPAEIDFHTSLPLTPTSYTNIFNLGNYNYGAASVEYFSVPGVNIKLNKDMKAPTVDEFQASFAYSFNNLPYLGSGYAKVTGIYKNWKNLLDYSVGNNGLANPYVLPVSGETYVPYIRVWDNQPLAKRVYRGLELETSFTKDRLSLTGGITWSSLKGNYEGEGSSTPGRGEGLGAWTVVDGTQYLDPNVIAPYGYLAGHVALRMRWQAAYSVDSAYGKTTIGVIYNFDSGAHGSDTRTISGDAISGTWPNEPYNATFTQYKDNMRGNIVYPSASYTDLAVTQDWKMGEVAGKAVNAFLKLTITNLWNHQQLLGTSRNYSGYPASYTDAFVPRSSFGTYSAINFGSPRAYSVSAGVRF